MKWKNLFNIQFFFDVIFTIVYLVFTIKLFSVPDNTYWAWFATSTVVITERWVSHSIWFLKFRKFRKNKNINTITSNEEVKAIK